MGETVPFQKLNECPKKLDRLSTVKTVPELQENGNQQQQSVGHKIRQLRIITGSQSRDSQLFARARIEESKSLYME